MYNTYTLADIVDGKISLGHLHIKTTLFFNEYWRAKTILLYVCHGKILKNK